MTLEAIKYQRGCLAILDQLLLPLETKYVDVQSVQDGWDAIHSMRVRGAPAIAIVGCLSLAIELHRDTFTSKEELKDFVGLQMKHLVSARKTAVNIKNAEDRLNKLADKFADDPAIDLATMKERILANLEKMLHDDVMLNLAIGRHGARRISDQYPNGEPIKILTHCNTGSLATAGFGTALGVVRALRTLGRLQHAYFTETRPYNQGSRLTAYELAHDKIPSTLICDDMVGWLMKEKGISAVVVGADRIVANGDTANKIGTYQLAILAQYHQVPFYVAAPTSSIDPSLPTGNAIPIEERPTEEITHINGIRIAAHGTTCWNPAFDVTPANLITGGIITEFGVYPPDSIKDIMAP